MEIDLKLCNFAAERLPVGHAPAGVGMKVKKK